MPLSIHERSGSLQQRERSHCRSSKLFAKIEVHNGSVKPSSMSHGSIKSPAMKAMRRAGGFAASETAS